MFIPNHAPKRGIVIALAGITAFVILCLGYAYRLHYGVGVPIGESIGKGIIGSFGVIGMLLGMTLYCFIGPLLTINDAWHHVIPVATTCILLGIIAHKKLRAPRRSVAIGCILLLWLVYGFVCTGYYVGG